MPNQNKVFLSYLILSYSSAMEFIESERGNQKLNIKLKNICGGQLSGGQLSGGLLSCSHILLIVLNSVKDKPFE